MVAALHQLFLLGHKRIISQVVETELVVRAVGDVGAVCLAPAFRVRLVLVDNIHREAVKLEHRPHPFRIALRQIRVNRDHMHPAVRQRVEIDRHDSHERFPLARLHLGNAPLVQHHSTQQLGIVRDHIP